MLRRAEAFQRPLMLRRLSHVAACTHPLGSMATPIIGAKPPFDPFWRAPPELPGLRLSTVENPSRGSGQRDPLLLRPATLTRTVGF